jgi:acetate---CoA ligase (ADP-forming)
MGYSMEKSKERSGKMENKLRYFFNPRGVALIGASSNPAKISNGVLVNMIQYGYAGKIYPVNPGSKEILGLPCYADISSVPDPVDLAVIMLPSTVVVPTLEACGKRGIQTVVVISGGFREVGAEGEKLEQQCIEVVKRYGMRLVGPNCVGTADFYSGLNTTFIRGVPDKGGMAFISQSGAVCGAVTDYVIGKGIGFSHFVSMGNEADVNETDLIEYFRDEPNTRVIVAYVEAIQDGQRFIQMAKEVTKVKPIVLLKAGHSDAGARAVSSHTGSLAGSYSAYQAAFKQAGVIEVSNMEDLFNVSMALANQPLPKGKQTVIITNAGGPAALGSDSLSVNGLGLAFLGEDTRSYLRSKLVPSAQVNNPIDMLGGATAEEYAMAVDAALKDENVDIAFPVNVPTSVVNPVDIANAIGKTAQGSKKPVICCILGDASTKEARQILHQYKVPMLVFPDHVGPVLKAMYDYGEWQKREPESIGVPTGIDHQKAIELVKGAGKTTNLGEAYIRPLLGAYKIPIIPGKEAHSAGEAALVASKIGYPVVMKIISPEILHKSDAGGIKLNVKDEEGVKLAYEAIMQNCSIYRPDAKLEGVLVESMAPKGQEVIVGMKRDPQFGSLIMFGLGGIYVELFGDVAFRIAPMTQGDAKNMIFETKAGKLLGGMRGQKPADMDGVVDCILRLSQIAIDFPEIEELEINPLLVLEKGQGVVALDARAILK